MKQLTCEMCGSTDLLKQDGVFACQSCGTKYSVEEAKKMMIEGTVEVAGTVKIDDTEKIENYFTIAKNAYDAGNYQEAENYCNKIIEIDPKRSRPAWLLKGKAAGWQTTGTNNRYPESIHCWINAKFFRDDIKTEAQKLGLAILQMKCNSFLNFRSEDNMSDIMNTLDMIEEQLELLREHTWINAYTSEFQTDLANTITDTITAISESDIYCLDLPNDELKRCFDLLNTAYNLSWDDNICYLICLIIVDNYMYRFDCKGNYEDNKNYWAFQKLMYDPEIRKVLCKNAVDLYCLACDEEKRSLARAQYWESHASKKAVLDNELDRIERQQADLRKEISNNSDRRKMDETIDEIYSVRSQMDSLGLFKVKEKIALAAKIKKLTATKQLYKNRYLDTEQQISSKVDALEERKFEIVQEFTKDRGTAEITPKQYITVFAKRSGAVSARDLISYHKLCLPSRFSMIEEDDDEFFLVKEFSLSLDGVKNTYSFTFQKNGENSMIFFHFNGKNLDDPIGDKLYYYLQNSDFPPPAYAVANFIQIVISAIIGICPSIDLTEMETTIAEVAYGLAPETSIEADNLTCTFTGDRDYLRLIVRPVTSEQ